MRTKVLEERRSNKSEEISHTRTIKERKENRDSETVVEGEPESGKPTLKGKILNLVKERKKGGEMLLIGKTLSPVDHDNLLMDIEVSRYFPPHSLKCGTCNNYIHVPRSQCHYHYSVTSNTIPQTQ